AELTEIPRGFGDAPWGIESAVRSEVLKAPVGFEDFHESISGAGNIVVFLSVLQGEGNEQPSVNLPDAKWREPSRDIRVGKCLYQFEIGVVLFNDRIPEICRVEECLCSLLRYRQAFVHGSQSRVIYAAGRRIIYGENCVL